MFRNFPVLLIQDLALMHVKIFLPFRLFWTCKLYGFPLLPHLSFGGNTGRNSCHSNWIPVLASMSLRVGKRTFTLPVVNIDLRHKRFAEHPHFQIDKVLLFHIQQFQSRTQKEEKGPLFKTHRGKERPNNLHPHGGRFAPPIW